MDKDKKIEELEQAIKSANELIKSTEDLNKRYKASLDEKAKEIERLKKLAADFLPMTTLADYKEKVTLLTEQAEDMFGLYIEEIKMERRKSMFARFWDISINIHTQGLDERKKVEP